MTTPPYDTAGFNRPRQAVDTYIAGQYEQLGLGGAPSLEEIEPHAQRMMRDKKVLEGIGLVLGRQIDAQEAQTDPDLRDITLLAMKDPEQAFSGLLIKLSIEDLQSER